jgi:ferredoxin
VYGRIDDVGLCAKCAAKLDRDMIRQRDWDYSATAFLVPDEAREDLRCQVVQQYGAKLELIAPEKRTPRRRKGRRAT